ncbi:MAG: hypothetical protein IIU86_04250 [Oscillospiraceae bacterium]|nr:hypothetical protein [Oscillospiraceae bacterium]
MKKSARRILTLVLSLVLICALAITAFALTEMARDHINYEHDGVIMTHQIIGYDTKVIAVISFEAPGDYDLPNDFGFDYSGYIDYQYCREEQVRPENYVAGRKNATDHSNRIAQQISTNSLESGYVMIDASMRFSVQFETEHSSVNHNRPDTIYIGIY